MMSAIELGGRNFLLEGIPDDWCRLLPARLTNCMVSDMPESKCIVQVEMSSDDSLRASDEPHDLNSTTHLCHGQNVVGIDSDWCEGQFNVALDTPVQFRVHVDSEPWFGGVVENLLRVLVAYDVQQRGGVMLHCAAIVKNNRAAVVFGHSGAGKSTSSALALQNGCEVISDDINIIEPCNHGWQVTPVPFTGTLTGTSNIVQPVPLSGLFRLHKSSEDRIGPCSTARAVSLLAGSSPFINRDPYRSEQLVDTLTNLCTDIPVRDLYFTRSDEFLRHLFDSDDTG